MEKHLAWMQCWILHQSCLSYIGQTSCRDLSKAREQELPQAGKERLTCIVGYNVAFVWQWLGGEVRTVTCWVKCGQDTWTLVSASGGNTPNNAARASIIRSTGIVAVILSCLLFLRDVSSVMAPFQFCPSALVVLITFMAGNHSFTHFYQSTKIVQDFIKVSKVSCCFSCSPYLVVTWVF